jgi:F0F1-type ATP synthase assembly protein I
MEPEEQEEEKERIGKPINEYARYSGIGFQMIATILIALFAGIKLDKWLAMKFPLFTLILTLLGVGIAMYVVIKEFVKKK